MPDRDTWRFINSFAPWLSALGTLAAVALSLYLARRTERPRVRVSTGIRVIMGEDPRLTEGLQALQIAATNLGVRAVTLQNLTWRTDVFRRTEYVQVPPPNRFSARLPTKLEHGDCALFLLPLEGLPADQDRIAAAISTASFPRLAVRAIRAGVVLTTGHVVRARIERSAQRWILDQVDKRKTAATAER